MKSLRVLVKTALLTLVLAALWAPALAMAQDLTAETVAGSVDAAWVLVAAILVLLMQAGFVFLETGTTRMKNAGHIAMKTVFAVGMISLVFWFAGYGLIFGSEGPFIGWGEFFFNPAPTEEGLANSIFFTFQLAFAAVSLSIAWGGFAERAKMSVYLVFSILFGLFVYPVIAHWIWGSGWLADHGKQDFAGSTVVHLTGAMAALAGTLLLKPRIGKYNKDGTPNQIHGHNQVFTTLGVFFLWIGWFGFNAGSTTSAGEGFFGYVAFNTQLAFAAGAVAGLLVSWLAKGKADILAVLNGALGGLVGITASCAFVEPWAAIVIGAVSGLLVYYSMIFFDKIRVDDPVGVLSVHGVAGVWGTLSNGLFAVPSLAEYVGVGQGGLFYTGDFTQLWVQTYGVVVSGVYAFVASLILLGIMKALMGLRVTEEEEIAGLDLSQHGIYGYPEQMKASS